MTSMSERRKATDQKILRAAVIEFGNSGYTNTTLASIAKISGITAGLIIQNFGSKENLYKRIAIDVTTRIQEELRDYSSTWELRCKSIVENTVKMLKVDPDTYYYLRFYVSLIMSLDTPEDIHKVLYKMYSDSPIEKIIKEAQARGEVLEGEPYLLHSLFWQNMNTVICYCYNNKIDYPPTEWFLQLIRKH